MTKVSDENLDILIAGLTDYRLEGIVDPWVLSNGMVIDPLDVLTELKELRNGT